MKYKEIFNLEKLLINPKIRKTKETLDMIISEDFIEFGICGNICDKNCTINDLMNEKEKYMKISEFRIRQLDDCVIQATYIVSNFDENGKKIKNSLRSSIWRLIDENWQIIFHQGTNIIC